MRLIKYINEQQVEYEDGNKKMFDTLKQHCGPFLKEAKKFQEDKFLFRGSLTSLKPNHTTGLEAKKVRPGREPRDIPIQVHKALDKKMKRDFGWFPRSEGVFATSSYMTAGDFGVPYLFFPAGRFKFVYGLEKRKGVRAISDVLGALDRANIIVWRSNEYILNDELSQQELDDSLEDFVTQFTDKNLAMGVLQGAEIMFNCKYYYLAEREDGFAIAKNLIWG